MKFGEIKSYCRGLKNSTKLLLKAGVGIFLLISTLSLLTYTFGELFCPDFNTAEYYADELFFCAKECLGAVVVPALLYEIFIRIK